MRKGFTLIESLFAVTIASAGTALLIKEQSEENKINESIKFSNDIQTIIQGIDHRISIDGYDPSLWTKMNWANEEEIVKDLLGKELVSTGSNCSGGTWTPSINSELETKLIECNLWEDRNGIEVDMNASLHTDSIGFIQRFDLIFNFKNQENFEDYFLGLKNGFLNTKLNKNKEISGLHTYELVSLADTTSTITTSECINNFGNCAFKASYNRSGGNEYLRADGGNSMIGEHITFIETKGQAPMKCIRWENTDRNGSGTWTQKSDEDCGVGIYNTTPVSVDIVGDTGTFKNILLDKECIVYEWNGTNVIDNGKRSPCGTTNDGTMLYQAVENTIANTATFLESRIELANIKEANINKASIEDLTVNIANINEIVTPLINTNLLNVNGLLQVNGRSLFTNGIAEFGEDIYVDKDATINKDLLVYEETTLLGNTEIQGETNILNNLTVKDNLTVTNGALTTKNIESNNIIVNSKLKINSVKTVGSSCSSSSESIAISNTGMLLSCQSGKWKEPEAIFTPEVVYEGAAKRCVNIDKKGYYIAYTHYGTSSVYVNDWDEFSYGSSMTSSNSSIGVYYTKLKEICGRGNHGTPYISKLMWQHP